MIPHPAKFTDSFMPVFAELLMGCDKVLDPFAGTGKLAKIKRFGFSGKVYCSEIEPEWANQSSYPVDGWTLSDSANLPYDDEFFDGICTSPTYGNRIADHHLAKDGSRRTTYRHYLGRPLNEDNTGKMQWGEKYRHKHIRVYRECIRVLKSDGIFILNISDHVRNGGIVDVSDWHKQALLTLGLHIVDERKMETRRMRFGENNRLRVDCENIFVFNRKGERDDKNEG